ncbi:MAG TPA: hypothetical protein VF848_09765 [Steroidobacteraceae bacterium]
MTIRKILIMTALSAAFAGLAGNAFAETNWQKNHPRRTEVNKRLANQNRRIGQEVKEGEMSKGKAAQLHHEDHQIRQEERDMASQDGGHITKSEKRVLNQQENGVSKQIGQ